MVSETLDVISETCVVVCATDGADFYRSVGVFETRVRVRGTCGWVCRTFVVVCDAGVGVRGTFGVIFGTGGGVCGTDGVIITTVEVIFTAVGVIPTTVDVVFTIVAVVPTTIGVIPTSVGVILATVDVIFTTIDVVLTAVGVILTSVGVVPEVGFWMFFGAGGVFVVGNQYICASPPTTPSFPLLD